MNNNSRGYAPMAPTQPDIRLSPAQGGVSIFPALTALVLAIVINFLVLRNVQLPIVRPVLGFWFIIIFPS